MSIPNLPTDFKDDILNTGVNQKRKYQIIYNNDGTVSFEDVTAYSQTGSDFGSSEVNATNGAINNIYDERILNLEDLDLVTEPGFFVDALAVAELNGNIENRTPQIKSGSVVVKGIGQKHIAIFTLADLCEMFGVTTEQSADFTVYAENGDDQAYPHLPLGVVYNPSGKQWLWWWDTAVPNNKSIRMNYVVFYSPGSTVG